MRFSLLVVLLILGAGPASADEQQQPIRPRHVLGTLHGFPSMSDTTGQVIADGELTQERAGDRLRVRIRWVFADGREVEERDEFQIDKTLAQRRFSWVETRNETELRRFEIDFLAGRARAVTRNEKGELEREESEMELPAGAFLRRVRNCARNQCACPESGWGGPHHLRRLHPETARRHGEGDPRPDGAALRGRSRDPHRPLHGPRRDSVPGQPLRQR